MLAQSLVHLDLPLSIFSLTKPGSSSSASDLVQAGSLLPLRSLSAADSCCVGSKRQSVRHTHCMKELRMAWLASPRIWHGLLKVLSQSVCAACRCINGR
eukprot:2580990-Amphidinium_carterae.1